jgi:hypothetical protein
VAQEVDYIVFFAIGIVQLTTPTSTMESMVVPDVILHNTWITVDLIETCCSPIAVCKVQYNSGTDLMPALVRIKNVLSTSFEIRLQNPKGTSSQDLLRDVHCVVVEQGAWTMPGGRKIEANKYLSTETDHSTSWTGEKCAYTNAYTKDHIVLGQVMSYNDASWSVFWSRGSKLKFGPDKDNLWTGKHTGENNGAHLDKTVGYIVIDEGTRDSVDGIPIETRRGSDIAVDYEGGQHQQYAFFKAFDETPEVAVLSQVGMKNGAGTSDNSLLGGEDGSWAVLAQIVSDTFMLVAVYEDEVTD